MSPYPVAAVRGHAPAPAWSPLAVSWTTAVNVAVSGNSLAKNAGGEAWNAGAVSVFGLRSGDGYAEFIATETDTFRAFGLSNGDSGQGYADIDFAIVLWATGAIHVYEFGDDQGEKGTYSPGDVLRVEVSSGAVLYKQNGTVIYTSGFSPTYPLVVDTSLYSDGATITNAMLSGANAGALRLVVCDGNSLTSGQGVTTPYPARLASLLGGLWNVMNLGVSGQTTAQMAADAATQIDPLFSVSHVKDIYIAWEITNDLYFGGTAVDAIARNASLCAGRQAAGALVVAVTVLPRSSVGTPESFEDDRQTVNASIRANWETYADALYDPAADSRIGDAGDELDTTYYQGDAVHLNDTGAAIIASGMQAQVAML